MISSADKDPVVCLLKGSPRVSRSTWTKGNVTTTWIWFNKILTCANVRRQPHLCFCFSEQGTMTKVFKGIRGDHVSGHVCTNASLMSDQSVVTWKRHEVIHKTFSTSSQQSTFTQVLYFSTIFYDLMHLLIHSTFHRTNYDQFYIKKTHELIKYITLLKIKSVISNHLHHCNKLLNYSGTKSF